VGSVRFALGNEGDRHFPKAAKLARHQQQVHATTKDF
jgi:hypothetical protein